MFYAISGLNPIVMNNEKKPSRQSNEDTNQPKTQKTAADFEQTAQQADEEKRTLKPGQSQGSNSKQHNNGRGGGK
jgi:hypothetical protein